MSGQEGFINPSTVADVSGFNIVNKPSSMSLRWLNKGSLKASSSVGTGTLASREFTLGVRDKGTSTSYQNPSNETYGFLGIGRGLTTAQETAYYNAVASLRSAIAAS